MIPPNPEAMKVLADRNEFHVGTPAYYDTFAGLVPCKVLEITGERLYGFRCGPYNVIRFRVTADHGPYHKGEILTADAAHVPPRSMIKRRQYSSRIITTYCYAGKTPA